MAASGANQPSIGYGISSSDRQPSYAAAVSGSAPMNYAIQPPPIGSGGLSNLVQQSRLPPRHHARNPSQPQMQIHDPTGDHGSSVPASLSRSLGRESNPRPASNAAPFITPSFLQNSRYVEKLEVAFRAKTAAAHEMASSVSRSGIHALSRHPSSGSLPKPKMQPHRGVRHDIVEMEIEDEKDGLEPLPSKWSETDKCPGLELLADGLEVKLSQTPKPDEHRAAMVRADHPMPAQCGIYYYEVTILPRLQKDSCVAVGFCTRDAHLDRPPGWDPDSWGYHGDDGQAYCCHHGSKPYGQTFGSGDTVGCGLNFRTGSTFFTKNGYRITGFPFDEIIKSGKPFYPSIGFKTKGEHVRTNFGQKPFVFDIDTLVKQERALVEQEIQTVRGSSPRGTLAEPELIHVILGQYLQHEGYIGAARAFTEELEREAKPIAGDSPMASFREMLNDPQLGNRQQIKDAILAGNTDEALRLANQHFPKVLPANESIYFKLRCRRFLEMMRETSEIYAKAHPEIPRRSSMDGALITYDDDDDDGNGDMVEDAVILDDGEAVEEDDTDEEVEQRRGDGGADGTDAYDSVFEQDMELDEPDQGRDRRDDRDQAGILPYPLDQDRKDKHKESQESQDDGARDEIRTRVTEVSQSVRQAAQQYDSHSTAALTYGRALEAEFRPTADSSNSYSPNSTSLPSSLSSVPPPSMSNPQPPFAAIAAEVQHALSTCFALMAYPDPLRSDLGEKLLGVDGKKGREELAEDINSAILVGLGRGRRSALEVLVGQMEVLVSDLGEDGGAAALINVGRDYLGAAL